MRRWGVGAASGVLAGMLACSEPPVFTCGGDDDCVLGGVQGQCQASGSCAYPDEDCTSGLSYPEGAPPDLAGRCVPGEGTGTGTEGGDTAATDAGSTGAASSGGTTVSVDDGSGTTADSTGFATSDSSTGMEPTDSSGGVECNDDEFGDSAEKAFEIGVCSGKAEGILQDPEDTDWFALGVCSGGFATVEVMVDDPDASVVCLVPLCEQPDGLTLDCSGGSVELPGMDGSPIGCCGFDSFDAQYDCGGLEVALYAVAASAQPGVPACTGYAFTVIAEAG